MSSSIYSRLAVTNIKNNRKTYVPYILAAILTVMMYYIMDALSKNPEIGDGSLKSVLDCAVWVIIIFAIIFLFYTNSTSLYNFSINSVQKPRTRLSFTLLRYLNFLPAFYKPVSTSTTKKYLHSLL